MNPNRHPQRDFFIADIVDASLKDDVASMEFPLFALKAGDIKVRTFTNDRVSITIKPTADGIATIFDKDIWIYCISQLDLSLKKRTPSFMIHERKQGHET